MVNWHKYNWTSSVKFKIPLGKEIENVKNADFKAFLTDLFNGIDTVSIPYQYRTDTTVTVTDTDTDTDTISDSVPKEPEYYPNDEILNKAFSDYVAMRKKIKAPMTDRAIELAIKKLDELSNGDNDIAIKIIEQSIMNGWKGFFELKQDSKTRQDNFFDLMSKA